MRRHESEAARERRRIRRIVRENREFYAAQLGPKGTKDKVWGPDMRVECERAVYVCDCILASISWGIKK